MIDPLLASVIAGISAACVISYVFGRLHGAEVALKSRRPIMAGDDAPGDCWPHHSDLRVHERKDADVRA